jgi:phospholipid N-methyltransferase
MTTFNPIAQSSFANSTAYNTHRPNYPTQSIQHLLEQCRVAGKKGARIVDLGAGTGIFTEALSAREEGFEIVAVEPHADMRAVLEKRNLRGVKVVDGTAEDVPVVNGWADAVFVAQVGGLTFLFRISTVVGALHGNPVGRRNDR